MAKAKAKVAIGDAIEVKVEIRTPFKRGSETKWLPATVCFVDNAQVGAAFSDGDRLALPIHDSGRNWRYARR